MKINEIFGSIDGEGIRTGELTTFIRSSKCCLRCVYCFGIKKGRNYPCVHLVKSLKEERKSPLKGTIQKDVTRIPLNIVREGDEIFTFDNQLNIVTTKVEKVLSREVTEWYEIKLGKTLYFVTPEHPFFTTSGMKLAKDLKIGDMILHTSGFDLCSTRMKLFNPMFNPDSLEKSLEHRDNQELGRKLASNIRKKKEEGTYKSTWELLTPEKKEEMRKKISESKKREKNPNWIENYSYRNYEDLKKEISKHPEKFNCECCGKNGTEVRMFVHHLDENHENDSMDNLSVVCSKCHNVIHERGYNFWTSKRKDGKVSLSAVSHANGIEVQSIKHIDLAQNPFFGRPYGPKPLTVYNLSCQPYNTYFLDYMWVHNCDTRYAFEEGTEMSVDDIISKCDEIGYHNITFTGGEPLIQPDAEELVDRLISKGYNVNIETSGAVDITPYLKKDCILTVDYKTPASGMNKRMIDGMFNTLREGDVLKFVMARSDFDCVKKFLKTHDIKAYVYFSPIFNEIEPKELVDFLKELHQEGFDVRKYRVQVQLHKVIWPPEMRGV